MNSFTDNTENLESLISGIFWIPYIALLFYLYKEHYSRGRNLQGHIILLLSFGAIFRCVWYWIYPFYGKYTYVLAINRIAILLQFSAVTLLVLMWCRALKISKWTDKEYKKLSKIKIIMNNNSSDGLDHHKNDNKYYVDSLRTANVNAMKKTSQNKFLVYQIIVIVINLIAWGLVLGTIGTYGFWYDFNIISISMAFAIIAFTTLIAGLRISKSLHLSLLPVYISNESSAVLHQPKVDRYACFGHNAARKIEYICDCFGVCSLLVFIYNPFSISELHHLGLQMQREVLRIILSVSFITFIFFMLRSFCFLYRPMSSEDFNNSAGDALYPFFFYQLPEFIPNLVIAWAISPPLGVLRKGIFRIFWSLKQIKMYFKGINSEDCQHRMTDYLGEEDGHDVIAANNNINNNNDTPMSKTSSNSINSVRMKSNTSTTTASSLGGEGQTNHSSTSTKVGSFMKNPIILRNHSITSVNNSNNKSMRYDTDEESWLAERRLSLEINEILYRINSMSNSRSISYASTLLKLIVSDEHNNDHQKHYKNSNTSSEGKEIEKV